MKRWEEVRRRMRFGFTDEQHERANRAWRDAWVRYQVLKTEYITYSTGHLLEVLVIMDEWWNELTPDEKRKYIIWFKREARRIRLDIAENERPGAKRRIKKMRAAYPTKWGRR